MKLPTRLLAAGAVAGAVAAWRLRSQRRRQEELEWEAEVMSAIEEGRSAAEAAAQAPPPRDDTPA